jgi:chemotaxis protein CheC
MYIQISELEKDILRETMNLALSKAADSFSRLLHSKQPITITVPAVRIITPDVFSQDLLQFPEVKLVIRTKLEGELSGVSLLLFFEAEMQWILRHALTERELKQPGAEVLQIPLLLEMSNILTGAILTQFSDLLQVRNIGLPPESIIPETGAKLEELIFDLPHSQPIVLTVFTDFKDQNKVIELPLLLVLESASLFRILNIIREKGVYNSHLLKAKK